MSYTMDGFRKDVKSKMGGATTETPQKTSNTSYRVRVDNSSLNIRKGPRTNYARTGRYTGKGVITIIAESIGKGAKKWGKLKSGAGWIPLDYTKKI